MKVFALLLACLSAAAASPQYTPRLRYGGYQRPTCPKQYPSIVVVPAYKTQVETRYTTNVVPVYSTVYVTSTQVVPEYVTRTVTQPRYVPKEVVRTETKTVAKQHVVSSTVRGEDKYVTRTVYRTQTKYRTAYRTRNVLVTRYQPTTVYSQVQKTEYVASTVDVPRYHTETKLQTLRSPARTKYRHTEQTRVETATETLPAQTRYSTTTHTKTKEVLTSVYGPADIDYTTNTRTIYTTRYVQEVKEVPQHTTVAVPVYITSTRTKDVVRTAVVTSTVVKYTTVVQPHTRYVTRTEYVPSTEYAQRTSVVYVHGERKTVHNTVPIYVTATTQLPDKVRTVTATKTERQVVENTVVVTRPEYRETVVTQTVQAQCGYTPRPRIYG